MLDIDRYVEKDSTFRSESGGTQLLDFGAILAMLRRQLWLIIVVTIAIFTLAAGFAFTSTKQYTAEATLLLDLNKPRQFGERRPFSQEPTIDNPAVDSHVEILRSDAVALRVFKKLNLADSADFTQPTNIIGSTIRFLTSFLPKGKVEKSPNAVSQAVLDAFQKRLTVARVDQTFVLSIAYRSSDPELAAKVANAVAEAYLTEQLQAGYESVKRASTWMQERIEDLRRDTVASDAKLQAFRSEHNLVNTGLNGRPLMNEQQLGDLTAALSLSLTQRAEAKAAYERISAIVASKDAGGAVVASLADPTISELRQKYNDAALKAAETERRYGAGHQVVQRKQAEMAQINDAILNELRRIEGGARSSFDIADARVKSIQKELEGLSVTSGEMEQARVAARELERQVESDRTTYQGFLERYKSIIQEESFPISAARVLTVASVPENPSHPKVPLILFLGLFGGLGLGLGFATLRELLNQETFHTPKQVEEALGIPCLGILPTIEPSKFTSFPEFDLVKASNGLKFPDQLGAYRYAVNEPFAHFTESLRHVLVSANHSCGMQPRIVVGVVSSSPGEGKSFVAANFAQLARHYSERVLLIDADIRNPSLSRLIAPDCKAGLLDVVAGQADFARVVYTDTQTGLHFLPAVGEGGNIQSGGLLASEVMRQFLVSMEGRYDYVVIDLPPLGAVVDARAMAPFINTFVFVAEWGKTKRSMAMDCLRAAPQIYQKTVGAVLNKADMSILKTYHGIVQEAYYGRSMDNRKGTRTKADLVS
ncbi:Wzz/FepE/Etk N-terminal domain-containing protein [Xanthobacter autotrophicus]|uniref:Wzz/FepE/Etk N-terminal domain-containing protein n=1 Tax=Xanthobacter autotrophicus TaxID=280 RepID=UPI00372CCFBA